MYPNYQLDQTLQAYEPAHYCSSSRQYKAMSSSIQSSATKSSSTIARATGPSRLPSESTREASSRAAVVTLRSSSSTSRALTSEAPRIESTSTFVSVVAASVESQAALTRSSLSSLLSLPSTPLQSQTVVESTSWVHVSPSASTTASSTALPSSSAEASTSEGDRSNMSLRITIGVIAAFFLLFFLLLCIKPCKCFRRKDRKEQSGLGWNARKSTITGSWDSQWEKFEGDAKEVTDRDIKRDSRRSMRSVYTTNTYYGAAPGAPPLPILPPLPPVYQNQGYRMS